MTLKPVSQERFHSLKPGDNIYVKIGAKAYKSRVIRPAFYNYDADEPGYEIETSNGYCDLGSAYERANPNQTQI